MATSPGTPALSPTPPADTVHGPLDSLFMTMSGLGTEPATGRLLRGLMPYLDDRGAEQVFLLVERKRKEAWRESGETVSYQELVHWARDPEGGVYRGISTTGGGLEQQSLIAQFQKDPLGLVDWAAWQVEAAIISSAAPLWLETHFVDKPWGREGWYTGIEKRGVSRVRSPSGSTELPYALAMFPWPLMGEAEGEPILLKTLEPRHEEVLGDLYLEVHEEKWETYLVLEIDSNAWPDGTGCLLAGLDARVLARYRKRHGAGAEAAMVGDLREKIRVYEKLRREIDALADEALSRRKRSASAEDDPGARQKALAALPANLIKKEKKLRAQAEAFIGRHPLKLGDVACLPPGVLHSLQHGVKVVEFQTPTYERLIAMFAQKVVTQPHWDTDRALQLMQKTPYTPPATVPVISPETGVQRDQVVDFPQFQVLRTRLASGVRLAHPRKTEPAYCLLFVSAGKGRLLLANGDETPLAAGDACLLPAALHDFTLESHKRSGLTYLLAHPRLAGTP
ncbi:MAG: hypothetical protein O7B79_10030 [SAR324 cluster bacterium]|nr:hypothetical protein [SAR324 cluster bacterium]